jgi:hypothetical protein
MLLYLRQKLGSFASQLGIHVVLVMPRREVDGIYETCESNDPKLYMIAKQMKKKTPRYLLDYTVPFIFLVSQVRV